MNLRNAVRRLSSDKTFILNWPGAIRRQWLTALGWFGIAGSIGVLLRTMMVWPVPGLVYPYLLHTHSHVVLLGWAFNALFTALVTTFFSVNRFPVYKLLWLGFQVSMVGMLVFFPMQGYAAGSIAFSTLHVFLSYGMVWVMVNGFKRHDGSSGGALAARFLRWGLFFLAISTLGPYGLGYLKAKHLEASVWYNLSIYYYLHFLYNGWFIFGCLALVVRWLEQWKLIPSPKTGQRVLAALVISCFGSFSLSALWAQPPGWVWLVGAVSALLQLAAGGWLAGWLWQHRQVLSQRLRGWAWRLAVLAWAGFVLKISLQAASVFPYVVQWTYQQRHVVIAYLHLVFIGVISLFLLSKALHERWLNASSAGLWAFLVFFTLSELILVTEFVLSRFAGSYLPYFAEWALAASVGLWLSVCILFGKQLVTSRLNAPAAVSYEP
ncbi:hypothetical protein [Nibrella saemangeumensis]|uniref:hypothetical protein n=1 Tax=Nibrella saemangeumensis TaxID=1084526 RepID=UPI0031EDDEC0